MKLCLQIATNDSDLPSEQQFHQWAEQVFEQQAGELVIRLVDSAESQQLNRDFRGNDKPTNVLAFIADTSANQYLDTPELGDIVACVPIIKTEAQAQHKTTIDHWAHMIIHASLHLRGYDHQNESQAQEMEQQEIALLHACGIANPYQEIH